MASLATAPPPPNGAKPDQPIANANIERALASIADAQTKVAEQAKPGEYQKPCAANERNDKSDLWAQWYAALATRDAADWSYWAMFWSAVSLILSSFGLLTLLATIKQDKAGLVKVESANKTARDALLAEHRPHMKIRRMFEVSDDGVTLRFRLEATNWGKARG
jgi:hypothetical protein